PARAVPRAGRGDGKASVPLGRGRRRPLPGGGAQGLREAPHPARRVPFQVLVLCHAVVPASHPQFRAFWTRFLPWEAAFPDGAEPAGASGEAWADRIQGAERAARALATLAAEQREAVVLFEIDGYSIEEVAVMQGASV